MTHSEQLPGFAVPVRRATVGGVTVYSAPGDGPTSATLVFRVGVVDERLTTRGITHLVEHMAMPAHAGYAFEHNANVQSVRTIFWAHGRDDEAADFLHEVAGRLRGLPVERLEAERRILKSEAGSVDSSASSVLAATRFGARGIGLFEWGEPGLDRLSIEEVSGWAAKCFCAENAAAWTTGDPGALALELTAGERLPPPRPEQNRFTAPAYINWGSGGVAFTATTARTTAARMAVDLLQARLLDVLRYQLGLSYGVTASYEPLTADLAYVFVAADATVDSQAEVVARVQETIDAFLADGPSDEELERRREAARRYLRDPAETRAWLDALTTSDLLGGAAHSNEGLITEAEEVTSADVAGAAAALLDDVLFCIPEGLAAPEGMHALPDWDDPPVRGRRFRQHLRSWPSSYVTVGQEGVSLTDGGSTATVLVEDAVGVFRWGDRQRLIVRKDSNFLRIADGVQWRRGRELLRRIDETYPRDLYLDVDQELPVPPRWGLPLWLALAVGLGGGGVLAAAVDAITGSEAAAVVVFGLVALVAFAGRWPLRR